MSTADSRERGLIRRSLPDFAIVVGITLAVGLLSQRWSGLDTPDSSFYASLALHGDQITDRAVFTSYYWTRLGQIAPNMALTTALGPWLGFASYRLLLLFVIVASAYSVLRRFSGRATSGVLVALISLSTVVLSYLGNPYLTGSILAGTSLLIALALSDRRTTTAAAGATIGWLVMVLPPGALLAAVIWLAIRVQRWRALGTKRMLGDFGIAAVGAFVTFGFFLGLGRVIFPKMDWFATYSAAMAIKGSDFASTSPVWPHDISLLVPAGIAVVTIVAWLMNRRSRAAQLALTISLTSIVTLALISTLLMGGIALEAPMYQAMLWPPALFAIALTVVAIAGNEPWTRVTTAVAAVAIVAVFLSGHWPGALGINVGRALAVVLVLAAIAGLAVSRNLGLQIGAITGIAILLAGGQLLQNSRGPLGLYYLSPYNWAFNDNPISDKLHTSVNTEDWLLAHTTASDRILDWVGGNWVQGDRELYVVAGMQLWGENRVTLEPTITDVDLPRLNDLKPSVIAMYAPTTDQVLAFWKSIPQANHATAPMCYDFSWPVDPGVGHACLTRLEWSN